ncbi:serine threonine kinase protein [Rutstroemia sp. NJR-2017a BBW]|nr:serine threonine kinase protein [Rutstroemia sp. NJR-2017a BBW]
MILQRARFLKSSRMISTLVGSSGQVYKPICVMHNNPNESPEFSIYLASGNNNNAAFVLKPVHSSIFEQSQELKQEFGKVPQIRHHADEDEGQNILVYKFAISNLLEMINDCPPLPLQARKTILKEVGLALENMHARNWIHLDVKPDNVFIDWTVNMENKFCLQKVQLGDLDCALKLIGSHLLNHKIGNVMWQSPEGLLGRGMGKHSEVFSFGLLCLFVLTGVESYHPDFKNLTIEPEQVILHKLLSNFEPLPDALVKHVDDEKGCELLKDLWTLIEEDDEKRAEGYEPFEQWTEIDYPNLNDNAKRLILRMTNLDLGKRAEMADIMTDPYWDGAGSRGIFDTEECFTNEAKSVS